MKKNTLLQKRSGMRKFFCYNCNHEWEVLYEVLRPIRCPVCKSTNILTEHKKIGVVTAEEEEEDKKVETKIKKRLI